MTPLHGAAIAAAGLAAGAVNAIVGSGSLITFPTLLAVGYPAKLANVSNSIGLVPGSISGAVGYRRELAGQRRRMLHLLPASLIGGATGAVLLLALPGSVFRRVVPILILLAVVLVIVQPLVSEWRARRGHVREHPGVVLHVSTFATAVYGGYFGAAQSVIFLALLAIMLDDDLQRLNGLKNVITAVVNGVAAVLFMATTDVAWGAVAILVVASTVGGQVGAMVGRRIPAWLLRAVIVVVGLVVGIKLLVSG